MAASRSVNAAKPVESQPKKRGATTVSSTTACMLESFAIGSSGSALLTAFRMAAAISRPPGARTTKVTGNQLLMVPVNLSSICVMGTYTVSFGVSSNERSCVSSTTPTIS